MNLPGSDNDAVRLTKLGGRLQAVERKIANMDIGRPVPDPDDDWYHDVDEQGFVLVPLPRSAWRCPYLPGALPRPCTRRALLLSRIVPAVIRDLPVHLTVHPRTGLDGSALTFGALLFPGFDVLPEDEDDKRYFLARTAVGPTPEAVRSDVAAARHSCFAHVFPELTLMPDMRELVPGTLAGAEWNGDGRTIQTRGKHPTHRLVRSRRKGRRAGRAAGRYVPSLDLADGATAFRPLGRTGRYDWAPPERLGYA